MNNSIDTILLDMDGVIVNWVGGACRLFDVDQDELEANWGDQWGIHAALDITEAELWHRIDAAGIEFWSELEPLPWLNELWALCNKLGSTFILTSPSQSHQSPAGKVLWMNKHLADGDVFRDFLMGKHKDLCARPGSLLIDDRDSNCEKFVAAGGRAIVFPRVWNSNRRYADDPMGFMRMVLPEVAR